MTIASHDVLYVKHPSRGFVPTIVVAIALAAIMVRERSQAVSAKSG